MIYLGSPYSDPDPTVKARRYGAAMSLTADLIIKHGLVVYSPIVHNHELAIRYSVDGNWQTWAKHDLEMLSLAKAFIVYAIEGWDKSIGLNEEIKFAEANGIPIIRAISANQIIKQLGILNIQ